MKHNNKSTMIKQFALGAAGLLMLAGQPALAAVSEAEAARLKSELMPLGGERAGNADGTIPAWNGGFTQYEPVLKDGRRTDPFAQDKPLFSITAANMDQHADKLSDGVKAMFKRYPDTYRIDVYETRRTAAAPDWVYENTLRNATSATLVPDTQYGGTKPEGAYGGIPFPITESGEEAIWNHLVAWRGTAMHGQFNGVLGTARGDRVLTVAATSEEQYPYYFPDGSVESHNGQIYNIRLINHGPPIRAGEGIVGRNTWGHGDAHVYLTGQRRTRKLPESCCDTPTPATAGVQSFDELRVFAGSTKRFDWTLVGKQEMYIPYNSNRALQPTSDNDLLMPHHLNPDHVRWELHRVWVVEANVAAGQRHQAPRSRYYLDEDTWEAVLGDRWDQQGTLWKTLWTLPMAMPDLPATAGLTNGFYDLVSGAWFANNVFNESSLHRVTAERYPERIFTASGLMSRGLR